LPAGKIVENIIEEYKSAQAELAHLTL